MRLSESRESFHRYAYLYYERETDFPRSSYHFHRRVIDAIRQQPYENLLKSVHFLDCVYAVLATWGMDRMDRSASLVDFDAFAQSVTNNATALLELSKLKLHLLAPNAQEVVKTDLARLYENLQVMNTRARLVGLSKAMHHLLPDLVPPIDRKHTLTFFYGRKYYPEKEGGQMFLDIFDVFYRICRRLDLSQSDLRGRWDTSVPKMIDNAIIGFVSAEEPLRSD